MSGVHRNRTCTIAKTLYPALMHHTTVRLPALVRLDRFRSGLDLLSEEMTVR